MSLRAPVVSVVIPCYRGERLVAESIESVLAQTERAVEVIVVDDGSPDRSADIAASIGDERIRILRHEKNRGIAAARNTGLAQSRAEFVAFLDQDDLWMPLFAESLLRELRATEAEACVLAFCDVIERYRDGNDRPLPLPMPRDLRATRALLEGLMHGRFIVLGGAMARRSALVELGGFDESIRGGADDFDMLARLSERGGFAHVAEPMFVRRWHSHNYTSAVAMVEESLAVIDRIVSRHPELAQAARSGRALRLYRRATEALISGDSKRARADYRRSIGQRRWQPRAWMGLAMASLGGLSAGLLALWRRSRGL